MPQRIKPIATLIGDESFKSIIESANINFLLGAGVSSTYLSMLNSIESDLANPGITEEARIAIYKTYFNGVMLPCVHILNNGVDLVQPTQAKFHETLKNFKDFFDSIICLLLKRKTTILSKQVNVFTTNIDIFMEKVLEDLKIEYNDGFQGHLKPFFDLSNFKRTIHKKSLHFDNISEIPLINLFKMHGSLNWIQEDENIIYSKLEQVVKVNSRINEEDFIDEYDKLLLVNPEKNKFSTTVLNLTYYEILRTFTSELEKENSVLFILGFSLADEHIRSLILRCANLNPTLKVYIFKYSGDGLDMQDMLDLDTLKYNNIEIIIPNETGPGLSINVVTEQVFSFLNEITDD